MELNQVCVLINGRPLSMWEQYLDTFADMPVTINQLAVVEAQTW
jgi:hypothetical protein